jgi:malonate transporter and related proteins
LDVLAGLFDLLAPFFGLILLGYACGRLAGPLGGAPGLAWLQFFVIYVALPCMFFRLVSDKALADVVVWPFVAATTLGTFSAFALAFGVGLWSGRGSVAEAAIQGMAGAYANVGYMGPPLVLAALGPTASAPVALIFICDNLLLFTLVPLLMAAAGRERGSAGGVLLQVVRRIATHPFNLAVMVGLTAGAAHAKLPAALDQIVSSLAQTAAPTALFMLGLSTALRPLGRLPPEVPALVGIKLLVHPALAFAWLALLGSLAGGLAPAWIEAAVLMAALPPALNIFVVSSQYGLSIERASACLLVGTLASVATLTALLWLIRTGHFPLRLVGAA